MFQVLLVSINCGTVSSADLLLRTPCIAESQNRAPFSNLTNMHSQSSSQNLKNKGKVVHDLGGRNLFEQDFHHHNNVPQDSYYEQLGIDFRYI